jgi:sigma-B regulation protein RsbU (phosphoserine phosphatase)
VVNTRLFEGAIELENVRRNMAMAAQVQQRMIPARPPTVEGFDVGALYAPCYELGGDFYDFIRLPEDNWGVAICDVVGKGVRASLLMASIRASLRGHAVNVYEMSLVLDKVNRDLCADSLVSDFATMFYGVLSTQDRRLTYTNAGHAPPILVRDGKLTHLDSGGTLLGVVPMAHYEHRSTMLQPGDLIFAYTDGLAEALNFADEAFGAARIEQAVLDADGQGLSAQALAKHVVWTMRKFAGLQRRFDDTTVVAIRAL